MKPQTWKKKGAILVYVVLIMALLIVFGVGMIFLANHNSNTTVNEIYAEQAYLTARSGLRSTMTMMEEDTANTSDVASQLKTAKTLTSSVDLTANKLGTVSVQVSCTDTDCTILQIDSTGTYQGVSQTVTGYMKSSAPAISSPLVIFNGLDNSSTNNGNQATVIDFNGSKIINSKNALQNLSTLGLENYYQEPDFEALSNDSRYIVVNCNNNPIKIYQSSSGLIINEHSTSTYSFTIGTSRLYYKEFTADELQKIIVFYNYSNGITLYSETSTKQESQVKLFFADDNTGSIGLNFYGSEKAPYLNAWIVAPSSNVKWLNSSKELTLTGILICGTLSWRNGIKFTIDGTGQNPTNNAAFMNLYNMLAGGGWTRSYEKP